MSGEERAGNRRELKAEEGVEEDWKVSENLLPGLYFTFPGNGLSILLSYSSSFTSPFHELLSSLSPARQIKVWPGEGKIESSGKGCKGDCVPGTHKIVCGGSDSSRNTIFVSPFLSFIFSYGFPLFH